MKRYVLLYGMLGGLLVVLLRYIEYRYIVIEHSIEIYGGLIAVVFVLLGLALGTRITGRPRSVAQPQPVAPVPMSDVPPDGAAREAHRITKRELEILALIAAGLTNREIADRLFVSENTVKTHSSRLFEKLSVNRRTQAVQVGQRLGLIP
ncbi:MAG: response regulator transcription factor [Gemmatimonadaceae bacterium]|nr:response regulator transcription factor [Gemmatimonadaceae bacterium]